MYDVKGDLLNVPNITVIKKGEIVQKVERAPRNRNFLSSNPSFWRFFLQ